MEKLTKIRTLLFVALGLSSILSSGQASDSRLTTVPALAVGEQGDGRVGYIAVQLDRDPQLHGPTIQFSEIALGRGSTVGEEWKEGGKRAVLAAAAAVGQDPRSWTVTIRNHSYNSLTEGSSSSSAIAVGLMAAWLGDTIRADVAITGMVTADGRIREVADLPAKLEGAAKADFHTLLVPRGQAKTAEWNLFEVSARWNMTVVEVESLQQAYDLMTNTKP
ncbi:MAG: S16 family serine protease [Nitrospiraceae bacterium]